MMAGGDGGNPAVAGGLAPHIHVLGRRIVKFLGVRDGGVYIDATFGAGGYTREILAAGDSRVIGIDRDQSAITLGAELVESAGGRFEMTPHEDNPGKISVRASSGLLDLDVA